MVDSQRVTVVRLGEKLDLCYLLCYFQVMKRNEITSNVKSSSSNSVGGVSGFQRVRDSRNRPVKGLQTRNGKYYAYLKVSDGTGMPKPRRFPLSTPSGLPVANISEATEALAIIRVARATEVLPTAGRKPSFFSYAETYLYRHLRHSSGNGLRRLGWRVQLAGRRDVVGGLHHRGDCLLLPANRRRHCTPSVASRLAFYTW